MRCCEDCTYYYQWTDGERGECRRYPPVFLECFNDPGSSDRGEEMDNMSRFPVTYGDFFCGEFVEKSF